MPRIPYGDFLHGNTALPASQPDALHYPAPPAKPVRSQSLNLGRGAAKHFCGPHRHTAADEASCVRKALEPPRWAVHRQVPVFVKLIRKTSEPFVKPALL